MGGQPLDEVRSEDGVERKALNPACYAQGIGDVPLPGARIEVKGGCAAITQSDGSCGYLCSQESGAERQRDPLSCHRVNGSRRITDEQYPVGNNGVSVKSQWATASVSAFTSCSPKGVPESREVLQAGAEHIFCTSLAKGGLGQRETHIG